MAEEKKINIDRIVAIIGLLLTIGAGGYVKSIWNDSVHDSMVQSLQDEHSKFYQLLKKEAHDIAQKEFESAFKEEAETQALTDAFDGFMGLDPLAMREKMHTLVLFADSIIEKMPEIQKNHAYTTIMRETQSGMRSFRVVGNGKPQYVFTLDGKKREVFKGKPDLRDRAELYYYRNSNDQPVALPFIDD